MQISRSNSDQFIIFQYLFSSGWSAQNMSNKKFKTVADLGGNRDEEHDSGSGSEDVSDDERQGRRQGFFVGGSEHR